MAQCYSNPIILIPHGLAPTIAYGEKESLSIRFHQNNSMQNPIPMVIFNYNHEGSIDIIIFLILLNGNR